MRIGVPSEIKPQEKRVGLTPESVAALISDGHEVIVQAGAVLGLELRTRPMQLLVQQLK